MSPTRSRRPASRGRREQAASPNCSIASVSPTLPTGRRDGYRAASSSASRLDPASTKAVEDIIGGVAQSGVKVVMATHDLGQARRLAGEIAFMLRGTLHECTEAERFFTAPATPEAAAFTRGDLVI